MRWFMLRLLAGLGLAAAPAMMLAAAGLQETEGKAPAADPTVEAMGELAQGRYLAAISQLRAAASEGTSPMAASMLSQVEPFITGVPARPEQGTAQPDPDVMAAIASATVRPAILEIVERARQTNIVILNEAHDNPAHRAFGLEVARALRPLGYTILAMEAFGNPPDAREAEAAMAALMRRGHATRATGFYVAEPVFADFIRQSLAIGYRPVAYEDSSRNRTGSQAEQIARREQGQADNLMRQIFARDPDARVFIYVGYSHAAEAPLPRQDGRIEWMAARLKRMTGRDPLTIDQTGLTEFSESPTGRAYHQAVAQRIGDRSGVLMVDDRPLVLGPYRDAVDIQVVHSLVRFNYGRPDWLWRMGRTPAQVPQNLRPSGSERLVQAFAVGEGEDAVPLDQVLVRPGEPVPVLMLPRGPVRFAVQELASVPARTERR